MNADAPRMHDLVIVGGGLVGASLALALEPLGLDIALVDAAPAGALPPVFDERSLSFAEATVNALGALGVMQALQAHGGPIRRIVVTRAGDFGQARLDATRYGRTMFGQVVVARDFGRALEARLDRMSGLTRYRPARLRATSLQPGSRRVLLDAAGETVRLDAPLIVGADGTASMLRVSLGIGAD
jgi:2-octaprenyl-6-methoxyphenol hydroxylase